MFPNLKKIVLISSLLSLSNCGGEAVSQVASIAPPQAFVLNVDRNFAVGIDSFVTIPKPNTQFQLRIDNKGNPNPLTIVGMTLTVDGPSERTVIPVDPFSNLFSISGALNLSFEQRAIFAEVQPFQASYCMDKVDYLKQVDDSRACADIANDDATINIPLYGVSANATTPDPTNTACCPVDAANLQNIYIFIGGLQTSSTASTGPQTYNISADIFGYYGTIISPVSNFNQRAFFTGRSF